MTVVTRAPLKFTAIHTLDCLLGEMNVVPYNEILNIPDQLPPENLGCGSSILKTDRETERQQE
jgi:hypothetical protein